MYLAPLILVALGACALPAGRPAQCQVVGGAPRGDVALARSACDEARRRFAAVVGVPPAGTITLSDRGGLSAFTQGDRWALDWPTSSRLASGVATGSDGGAEARRFIDEQWQQVLPHELGHIMFGAWLYSPGRDQLGDYGTYMPDWVDEAVAISMEPPLIRADRLAQARAFTTMPPLAEVLAFRHPFHGSRDEAFSTRVVSSPPCGGYCPRERPTDTRVITERVFRDGRMTVDTAYYAGERALETDPLARFYVLSYALWAYVEARGGRPAIDALIQRLRRNPRDPGALAGLPGLPRTLAAVESDWITWLRGTATREEARPE